MAYYDHFAILSNLPFYRRYLVPMGNYTSLRDVVLDAELQGTNILSFRSTRGKLRMDRSV